MTKEAKEIIEISNSKKPIREVYIPLNVSYRDRIILEAYRGFANVPDIANHKAIKLKNKRIYQIVNKYKIKL